MDQIPSDINVVVALVIVFIAAMLAQRKWGSKALWWVWIASAVVITGAILSWAFYKYGLPSAEEFFQRLFPFALLVTYLFSGVAFASGAVIWWVAVFGPRPLQDSSAEVNYFPFDLPTGKLQDTHGLPGILRRYHELLATFTIALDAALASTPFNSYEPVSRGLRHIFHSYLPGYLRQARVSGRQFRRVPNALTMDLAGAHVVLAELETLTAAQLSAIEECHRVNVRRLRQRTIIGWPWGKIAVVCATCGAMISFGVNAVEQVTGVKPSDLWPLVSGLTFTWADLRSGTIQFVIYSFILLVLFFTVNPMTFFPILQRVQAFEDILTIAKAYCKGESGTNKPQQSAN